MNSLKDNKYPSVYKSAIWNMPRSMSLSYAAQEKPYLDIMRYKFSYLHLFNRFLKYELIFRNDYLTRAQKENQKIRLRALLQGGQQANNRLRDNSKHSEDDDNDKFGSGRVRSTSF